MIETKKKLKECSEIGHVDNSICIKFIIKLKIKKISRFGIIDGYFYFS